MRIFKFLLPILFLTSLAFGQGKYWVANEPNSAITAAQAQALAEIAEEGNATLDSLTAGAVELSGPIDQTIDIQIAGGDRGINQAISQTVTALTGTLTGAKFNARVNVESPSGSVTGIDVQAGNMSAGYGLSAVRGGYFGLTNKVPSGAVTWTYARGLEVNMDLDQGTSGNANTITNAAMLYGVYNLPTAGSYSTVTNGYGIFLRNEAVGGTGQMLDAGFYLDDASHSGGIYGWDYGFDFSGIGGNSGAFGTADGRLADGSLISGAYTNGAVLATATGVTNVNYSSGLNQTVITFTNYAMPIVDSAGSGGHGTLKLVDFPEGVIRVPSVIGDIGITAVVGIGATGVFDMAMGSATTLTNAETLGNANVDFVAKVDGTLSSGADDIDLVNTTSQDEDGHSSNTEVWLCVAVMDADMTATGTMTFSGTIVITWHNMGDY